MERSEIDLEQKRLMEKAKNGALTRDEQAALVGMIFDLLIVTQELQARVNDLGSSVDALWAAQLGDNQ